MIQWIIFVLKRKLQILILLMRKVLLKILFLRRINKLDELIENPEGIKYIMRILDEQKTENRWIADKVAEGKIIERVFWKDADLN